jgi:peptide/nickel transport system ATP-binding protein
MNEPPLLELVDVSRTYNRVRQAVADVSFKIPRGTTLALIGASGSGKTTLARIVAGLLEPDEGVIRLSGQALPRRGWPASVRRKVNMVFQHPLASLDPHWTTGRSIAEPLSAFGLAATKAARAARVAELLEAVGLPSDAARRRPSAFSLGQVQRIAIARALAADPALLVCDEPTSALDLSVQAQVLNLLRDLQERLGLTLLVISHDPGVVRFMADTVAVLDRGRIVELGPAAEVFNQPRLIPTRSLLGAGPE